MNGVLCGLAQREKSPDTCYNALMTLDQLPKWLEGRKSQVTFEWVTNIGIKTIKILINKLKQVIWLKSSSNYSR